jgi:hypothetical protein
MRSRLCKWIRTLNLTLNNLLEVLKLKMLRGNVSIFLALLAYVGMIAAALYLGATANVNTTHVIESITPQLEVLSQEMPQALKWLSPDQAKKDAMWQVHLKFHVGRGGVTPWEAWLSTHPEYQFHTPYEESLSEKYTAQDIIRMSTPLNADLPSPNQLRTEAMLNKLRENPHLLDHPEKAFPQSEGAKRASA